jgi:hypothetical protein
VNCRAEVDTSLGAGESDRFTIIRKLNLKAITKNLATSPHILWTTILITFPTHPSEPYINPSEMTQKTTMTIPLLTPTNSFNG